MRVPPRLGTTLGTKLVRMARSYAVYHRRCCRNCGNEMPSGGLLIPRLKVRFLHGPLTKLRRLGARDGRDPRRPTGSFGTLAFIASRAIPKKRPPAQRVAGVEARMTSA
jgi:hypothetical protein